MRKFCSTVLISALIICCMSYTAVAADISVTVNGEIVGFSDAKPYINNDNRILVPLRAIAEALNLDVTWDDTTKSATFEDKASTKKTVFSIGENKYIFVERETSKGVEIDTAAVISNDRIYAPARYLAEAFGYSVVWDENNSIVSISSSLDIDNKNDDNYKAISSFIPNGWEILKTYGDEPAIVDGDLNNDGILDKAFIVEESGLSESDYSPQRNLIILFGEKDNSYKLAIIAKNAVLLKDEGGAFGDPFESIQIDRGSLVLNFMGGSIRWHRSFRFRYQDDGWYLIGFTECGYELIGESMECLKDDYNLITGDYIGEKVVDGEIKTIEKNIGKNQLLNLKDFVAAEYNIQQ